MKRKQPPAKSKLARELIHGHLCDDCATSRGGIWPEGHQATSHLDVCLYCNRREWLAAVSDYNWPDPTLSRNREF